MGLSHLGVALLSLVGYIAASSSQPNFIFFLTDDQDLLLDSLDYMPRLTEFFSDGVRFLNAFATTPVCCPSRFVMIIIFRSSIHTGRYIHNTGTQNNTVAGLANFYSKISILSTFQFGNPKIY